MQLIAGPWGVSMNTDLTFHHSGTGPAGRRAGRVPSLAMRAIHQTRQPAIPDEGRWANKGSDLACPSLGLGSFGLVPRSGSLVGVLMDAGCPKGNVAVKEHLPLHN